MIKSEYILTAPWGEATMNDLEMNIAVARGEALAASLLASAALQAVFTFVPPQRREELLSRITAFVDDTLNRSGPAKGDAQDEPNTQMREKARFQAMQHLDAMALSFKGPSTQ
jgi:hypothetical protein